MKSRLVAGLSITGALGLVVGSLSAGPLDPPAGPVGSSFKTLSEAEPRIMVSAANTPGDSDATPCLFKITKSGSYYLGSDVIGVAGKGGIDIEAAEVTLDLNGFTCKGVAGSLSGIRISSGHVSIVNGRVNSWGAGGIKFMSGSGTWGLVRSVQAGFNTGTGIDLSSYSSAIDCTAEYNSGIGIDLYALGAAINCTAQNNGTTVDDAGINIGNGNNHVINCRSVGNIGCGFSTSHQNMFEGCLASGNGKSGFEVGDCQLTRCTSSSNVSYGFDCLSGNALVNGCQAANNTLSGFVLGPGCVVTDSMASGHASASGAGFYVAGGAVRITSSHAHSNARGFFAASNMNAFLAMNTSSGNTTAYAINAGNDSGAVISNPGTGFATTNPFANIAP